MGVEYVDVVTEAGPVGVLSQDIENRDTISIFRRIEVSINVHLAKGIAIVAHQDCAGNPLPDSEQKLQLQICQKILSKRYPQLEVIGLWFDLTGKIQEY